MRLGKRMLGLFALASVALLSGVHAAPMDGVVDADAAADDRSCADAPPCGYINPLMDLDFPNKPTCDGGDVGFVRNGAAAGGDCLPVPSMGESITQNGTLTWYWEITEDATYPNDPQTDIIIQFSTTANNPDWLAVSVEPSQFILDTAALFDPQNMKLVTDDPANPQLWYWFQRDITVTFTRTGDPGPDELQVIKDRDGVRNFFLKAKSNASGERFKEAFGVEEFRFDTMQDPTIQEALDPGSNDAPAPGVVVPLLAVGTAALLIRRRW